MRRTATWVTAATLTIIGLTGCSASGVGGSGSGAEGPQSAETETVELHGIHPLSLGDYSLVTAETIAASGLTCTGDPVLEPTNLDDEFASGAAIYATSAGVSALSAFDGMPCYMMHEAVMSPSAYPGVIDIKLDRTSAANFGPHCTTASNGVGSCSIISSGWSVALFTSSEDKDSIKSLLSEYLSASPIAD